MVRWTADEVAAKGGLFQKHFQQRLSMKPVKNNSSNRIKNESLVIYTQLTFFLKANRNSLQLFITVLCAMWAAPLEKISIKSRSRSHSPTEKIAPHRMCVKKLK